MYFDLEKKADVKRLQTRVEYLISKQKKVEVTEKREKRTLSQNNYLHLILTWFCIENGSTLDFVKQEYFKKLCNPDIFIFDKEDRFLKTVQVVRSSSDIDTKQMTTAIERFRNWSASEAGIYLPDPNEEEYLRHIEQEMQRQQQWL